jgi:hypothetical protein
VVKYLKYDKVSIAVALCEKLNNEEHYFLYTPTRTPYVTLLDMGDEERENYIIQRVKENCPEINYVDIRCVYLTDLSCLIGNTYVTHFIADFNSVSDISAIQYNTTLTTLSLESNLVSDISSLRYNTTLERLSLSSNRISDISSIAGNTTLDFLDLGDNLIEDISVLRDNSTLSSLGIHGNRITDFTPLLGNLSITSCLWISRNPGTTSCIKSYFANMPYLNIMNLWYRRCTLFQLIVNKLKFEETPNYEKPYF